jgi:hypothetical protein
MFAISASNNILAKRFQLPEFGTGDVQRYMEIIG